MDARRAGVLRAQIFLAASVAGVLTALLAPVVGARAPSDVHKRDEHEQTHLSIPDGDAINSGPGLRPARVF